MLDLEPIRARLTPIVGTDLTPKPAALEEYYHEFSECGDWRVLVAADRWDEIPPMAVFIAHAPTDIAALLDEVERVEFDLRTTAYDLEHTAEKLALREAEIKRLEAIIRNAQRQLGAT